MQLHNVASMLIRRCLSVACLLVSISMPEEQINDLLSDITHSTKLNHLITKPAKWHVRQPEEQMNHLLCDIFNGIELSHLMTKPTKWHVRPAKTDHPGHPPSLIRIFAVHMKKACVLSYPMSTQQRLIRLGGCAGWSAYLLGAHSFCWVCDDVAQFIRIIPYQTLKEMDTLVSFPPF